MTLICYRPRKFGAAAMSIIEQARDILAEYEEQGYVLTLRQLYYQFVARGIIPNAVNEYKRLGDIVSDARYAGLLSWRQIEDRTRGIESLATWYSPEDILRSVSKQYRIDLWSGQKARPEVWIEKEALAGVIEATCEEERVDYLSCRGYTSASESWRAGQRICNRWIKSMQQTVILHLGDHDPSGIDMTRDNRERLEEFCRFHLGAVPFRLHRLALNLDQVEEFNPPPNPAKLTDTRSTKYVREFGDQSWELDALDPATINDLIKTHIARVRTDQKTWDANVADENRERGLLAKAADHWDNVSAMLEDRE